VNILLIRNNLCPLSFIDVPEQDYIAGTLGVYKFNQVDLLQDVFIWANERSCRRYLAITQTMVDPDPLRIRYREQVTDGVQAIVRGRKTVSTDTVKQPADDLVSEEDREAFTKMPMDALSRLHEGNMARYRLKLSEFQEWKKYLGKS